MSEIGKLIEMDGEVSLSECLKRFRGKTIIVYIDTDESVVVNKDGSCNWYEGFRLVGERDLSDIDGNRFVSGYCEDGYGCVYVHLVKEEM